MIIFALWSVFTAQMTTITLNHQDCKKWKFAPKACEYNRKFHKINKKK
jgi:hypothetical protein